MIVVSDTTPLRHLIAIGEVELLERLYGKVIIPSVVLAELKAEATPKPVRNWLENSPTWLIVEPSNPTTLALHDHLDAGESAAIQLTLELSADLLLIDDPEGREYALGLGLPVIGTLGVLERAEVLGFLPAFYCNLGETRCQRLLFIRGIEESHLGSISDPRRQPQQIADWSGVSDLRGLRSREAFGHTPSYGRTNILDRFSRPIVVFPPCPATTTVSSGSV